MQSTTFTQGNITIKQNPLTGDWFVYPLDKSLPYICDDKRKAIKLANSLQLGSNNS